MRRPGSRLAALAGSALFFAAVVFVAPAALAQSTPDPVNACPTDLGYSIVKLQNNSFNPAAVALPSAGGTACFEHDDGATPHSVTFEPPTHGDVDSNPDCSTSNTAACFHQGDAPFIVQLQTEGTYKYHCKIHSGMTGVVTVGKGVAPSNTTTTVAKTTKTTAAGGTTQTTVGSIATDTTTTAATTSTSTSSATTTTLALTTQTTSSALGKTSKSDNKPNGVLKAVGIVLLAAAIAALIPSWRRLT